MRPEMVAIVAIHEAIEAAGARGGRIEDVRMGPPRTCLTLPSYPCTFCQQQLRNYLCIYIFIIYIYNICSCNIALWAVEPG